MKTYARYAAVALLALITVVALGANFIVPADYATQFRTEVNAPPSHKHWLGTDDLGRDRLSRVVYGTRVSLLLAPAAALLSTLIAVAIGGIAGYLGGWPERVAMSGTDLFLSLPWLFLFLLVRAMLPLNVPPVVSIVTTFALLGAVGWAVSARVLCAGARALRRSQPHLHARALGVGPWRLFAIHTVPNLKPVLMAQFWSSIPLFMLGEANLGVLGLGVAEPLPSWGGLLRELETLPSPLAEPWKFVPLIVVAVVVSSLQLLIPRHEVSA